MRVPFAEDLRRVTALLGVDGDEAVVTRLRPEDDDRRAAAACPCRAGDSGTRAPARGRRPAEGRGSRARMTAPPRRPRLHPRPPCAAQEARRRGSAAAGGPGSPPIVAGRCSWSAVAASTGAGIAFSAGCDLNALQPVEIGQNSFVYADDGSLLGTIPAERNREPVPMSAMTPWLAKATVAIEDRRFYEHGGVDYLGIARARGPTSRPARSCRAARRSRSSSCATSTPGRSGRSTARSRRPASRSSCRASWSKTKILNDYLNTVYYGNHAYGVEAAAQTYFSEHARGPDAPPGGAASPGCRRRRRSTTRSTIRRRRCSGATRCCRRCSGLR